MRSHLFLIKKSRRKALVSTAQATYALQLTVMTPQVGKEWLGRARGMRSRGEQQPGPSLLPEPQRMPQALLWLLPSMSKEFHSTALKKP